MSRSSLTEQGDIAKNCISTDIICSNNFSIEFISQTKYTNQNENYNYKLFLFLSPLELIHRTVETKSLAQLHEGLLWQNSFESNEYE